MFSIFSSRKHTPVGSSQLVLGIFDDRRLSPLLGAITAVRACSLADLSLLAEHHHDRTIIEGNLLDLYQMNVVEVDQLSEWPNQRKLIA